MKTKIFKIFLVFLVLMNANNNLYSQASVTICAGLKGIKYQVIGEEGSTFHWMVQGGQIISVPLANTITINWGLNPGDYTIAVYEEKTTGCLGNTKTMSVRLQPSPIIDLGNFESICDGGQIELIAGSGDDAVQNNYLWQDGSTNSSFVARKSGIYWVEVTNPNSCSFRDSVNLVVNSLPKINLGKDTILCNPEEIILDAGNSGSFFEWSNGANAQTIVAHENDGEIWAKVMDQNGCIGYDTIQILSCLDANDLYIPRAFSPNNGTTENLWVIGGAEKFPAISVKIYDRWGILIFESEKGYPKPWDGTSNGKDMPMNAYYYIINKGDGSKDILGSVTLIR